MLKSGTIQRNKGSRRVIDCTRDDLLVSEAQSSFRYYSLSDLSLFSITENSSLENEADILAWCVMVLSTSSTARLMLREAIGRGWRVGLSDLGGVHYSLDIEDRVVLLDAGALTPCVIGQSNYFKNALLINFIQALRDIWQEKRYGGFDQIYRPDSLLLLERVRAADCDVVGIMVAWEIRTQEYGDLWRHLIGSENGDLAMIFSSYLERRPAAHFGNDVLAAVFKQWFSCSRRVNTCDHETLECMDDVLANTQIPNPFGIKMPGKIDIEKLSCLPDKTAYLQGLGQEILRDPAYSAMDDVINQTHLFHILYDLEVTIVNDVPFRSCELAAKIFPGMISDNKKRHEKA